MGMSSARAIRTISSTVTRRRSFSMRQIAAWLMCSQPASSACGRRRP
jgi:hypothetical protein